MAARRTRGAAAREANMIAADEIKAAQQQLSSPPVTPPSERKRTSAGRKNTNSTDMSNKKATSDGLLATPATLPKKRKRMSQVKAQEDPDELPHGLGKMKSSMKSARSDSNQTELTSPFRGRGLSSNAKDITKIANRDVDEAVSSDHLATKKVRLAKSNPYGIILGETPYPDWLHPTSEECQTVNDVLSKLHGPVTMPKAIPLPSLTVAGCGEVPYVLEALLRTLLSANTTNTNSGRAVQGIVKRFGVHAHGFAQGSIRWNDIRLAPREELESAIHAGGLAVVKSKYIKNILDTVYAENEARRAAIKATKSEMEQELADKKQETSERPEGQTSDRSAFAKASDLALISDPDILSLDYLHALSANEAFSKLISYSGIGVKTASCTLLFCMQQPSFAVDTHVFRLCKWLGWVPPDDYVPPNGADDDAASSPNKKPNKSKKLTRDTCFAHCDVRVPDYLKYSLHQLLIVHGKRCPRCRAITGEGSENWDKGCVLEDLVTRSGARKTGHSAKAAKLTTPNVERKKVPRKSRIPKKIEDEDLNLDVDVKEEKEGTAEEEEQELVPLKAPKKRKRASRAVPI
ncbi:hypothetical protein MMC09_001935 [Bachmanniomyces sp. S44760]|nr:hypothetical protein [Bachmanniomyces sp. S44760]